MPKELVQAVERVAKAAEEQTAQPGPVPKGDEHDLFRTFMHGFYPRGGVAFMHTKMDETNLRLTNIVHLSLPEAPEIIRRPPPWAKGETGASS